MIIIPIDPLSLSTKFVVIAFAGPPMGFRGMRDKAFFGCRIRDWLQNCRGIRDSNICGIWDWLQNHCGIWDSNISRALDEVRKFEIHDTDDFHLITREIEIAELTPQNIKR